MNEFDPKQIENLLKQMAQVNNQLQAQVGELVRANTVITPGSEQVDPSKLPDLPPPETAQELEATDRVMERVEEVLSPPPQEVFEKQELPPITIPSFPESPLPAARDANAVDAIPAPEPLQITLPDLPPPQEPSKSESPPVPSLSPGGAGNGSLPPVFGQELWSSSIDPSPQSLAGDRVGSAPPESATTSPGEMPPLPSPQPFPGLMVNGLLDVDLTVPPPDVDGVSPVVKLDKTTTGLHWEVDKMEDVHAALQAYAEQSRRWRKAMLSILTAVVDDLRVDATMLESIQRHFELGRRSL